MLRDCALGSLAVAEVESLQNMCSSFWGYVPFITSIPRIWVHIKARYFWKLPCIRAWVAGLFERGSTLCMCWQAQNGHLMPFASIRGWACIVVFGAFAAFVAIGQSCPMSQCFQHWQSCHSSWLSGAKHASGIL